jgi:hypothetical protein
MHAFVSFLLFYGTGSILTLVFFSLLTYPNTDINEDDKYSGTILVTSIFWPIALLTLVFIVTSDLLENIISKRK